MFMASVPLVGIIPPLVTPLRERDALDHAGLERVLGHVLAGGVHGVFLLGTTGEGPGLSHRLRLEMVERTCEIVNGRVPILVGITDTSFTESLQLAEHAADCKADAVVLAPPYYFLANQEDLGTYVEHLAAKLPLPLVLYNIPSHTKVAFDLDTVERLLGIDRIIGMKDSSADLIYFHKLRQMVKDRPNFSLLCGPEELLADTVLLGAQGGVCGGANFAPRLYVDLYEAAKRGDLPTVRRLHDRVTSLARKVYGLSRSAGSIKGTKCALSLMGLCEDVMTEPLQRLGHAERARLAGYLRELELLPQTVA
jgi:4-hydroxy-tetrahydrodipicolinate synthase